MSWRATRLRRPAQIAQLRHGIFQIEEPDCIASQHSVALVGRHAGECLVDHAARFGPIASGVGEVATPEERFDADIMAHAYAYGVFHETPQAMLL